MADDFTAKFKVDISDLKKNITEANKQIKLANATFKKETSGMQNWSKDADGLSSKLNQLKTVLSNQKKILSSYDAQLKAQQTAYTQSGKKAEELKAKLQDLRNNGVAKTDEEYQKYSRELRTAIKDQQNAEKATDDLKLKILNQQAAIGKTESQINKYSTAQKQLEASSKSLTNTVQTQQNELEQLKRDYVDVVSAEGKNSAAAKELANDIQKLSASLNENQRELQQSEAAANKLDNSFDKTSAKSGGLAGKLAGGLKKGLVAAGAGIAAMGAGAIAGGKKLASMVNETSQAGDQIDKMSQKLGLSAEAYQEWDYVLSQSGVDIKSTSAGFKTLINQVDKAKNGSDEAQERFKKLGISMSDLKTMSTEELFSKAVTGMQGMADSTDRAALANQLFGKSGQNLAPLFNSTAKSTEDLKKKAHDLGFVMSNEAVNASAKYQDSLDTLKRTFTGVKNNILSQLLPGFTSITTGLSELIAGQDGAKEKLQNGAKSIAEGLKKIAPKIVDVLLTIATTAAEVAPSIITSLVNGITANLGKILSVAIKVLKFFIDAIIAALPTVTQALLQALPTLINGLIQVIIGIVKALPTLLNILVKELPSLIKSIINSLMDNLPTLISGLITLVLGIVKAIPKIILGLVNALPEIIERVITGLLDCLPQLILGLIQLNVEVVKHLPEIIIGLIKAVPKIITSIANALIKSGPKLFEAFGKIFTSAWTKIQQIFANVGKWFSDKFQSAVDGIKNVFGGIGKWFGDTFNGIWNFIKAPLNFIIGGINAMIRGLNKLSFNIPNWVPVIGGKKFGFNIPTIPKLERGGVLDRGQIGLLEGSGSEAVVPLDRNKQWVSAVANGLFNDLRKLAGNGSINNVSNAKNVNYTQIINAPKQPSRIDIYRQTRNLLDYSKATGGV